MYYVRNWFCSQKSHHMQLSVWTAMESSQSTGSLLVQSGASTGGLALHNAPRGNIWPRTNHVMLLLSRSSLFQSSGRVGFYPCCASLAIWTKGEQRKNSQEPFPLQSCFGCLFFFLSLESSYYPGSHGPQLKRRPEKRRAERPAS